MATDPDGSKWLLQDKLREYYVQDAFGDDIEQAQKQIYLAVMRGEVGARRNGRELGPEWLKQISKMTFLEGEPFALPGDVELSVEDARRHFGT
jgi:hypothetical protein